MRAVEIVQGMEAAARDTLQLKGSEGVVHVLNLNRRSHVTGEDAVIMHQPAANFVVHHHLQGDWMGRGWLPNLEYK